MKKNSCILIFSFLPFFWLTSVLANDHMELEAQTPDLIIACESNLSGLAGAWAEALLEDLPNLSIELKIGSAGDNFSWLFSGRVNVVIHAGDFSFAELPSREIVANSAPVVFPGGIIAVVPIVNADLGFNNISRSELFDILSGKQKKWSGDEESSRDLAVVVPAAPSPVLEVLNKRGGMNLNGGQTLHFFRHGESRLPGRMAAVNPLALELVGWNQAQELAEGVKILSVDGIVPSVENIRLGRYPLGLSVNLVGVRPASQKSAVARMLESGLGLRGVVIARQYDLVPLESNVGEKNEGSETSYSDDYMPPD